MRRCYRLAKILATLGPTSSTEKDIEALMMAGVNAFRLNFSHANPQEHQRRCEIIRKLEKKHGLPCAVLADLQGPKLRVGKLEGGKAELKKGASFRLDASPALGNHQRVCIPHPEIFQSVEKGTDIFLDDGRIQLQATKVGRDYIDTVVTMAGVLSDHKGFNLPNAVLKMSALTKKDLSDLQHALDMGVDWVALSFVQTPEDVKEARKIVKDRVLLVSKIERPTALNCLEEIIDLSDAIMIARGDLGVEASFQAVPVIQNRVIRLCRTAGRPVIVATQMLESMVTSPVPTRAETSDIATAIYEGADAVMLSAETAAGKYPLEAVQMMDSTIRAVENDEDLYCRFLNITRRLQTENTNADAISAAARMVTHTINARAIVCYTTSGKTALRMARQRPGVPLICITDDLSVARALALVWGTYCHVIPHLSKSDFVSIEKTAIDTALASNIAQKGDHLVVTLGKPFGTPGTTNALQVVTIPKK